MSDYAVRKMRRMDVAAVHQLSTQCFAGEAWGAVGLAAELDREGGYQWILEALDGRVIAYLLAFQVLDEVELLQVAVLEEYRRMGAGGQLMEKLFVTTRQRGAQMICLEVRATNYAAIEMYQTFGFESMGVRRGYYREPLEDALVLVCHLKERCRG